MQGVIAAERNFYILEKKDECLTTDAMAWRASGFRTRAFSPAFIADCTEPELVKAEPNLPNEMGRTRNEIESALFYATLSRSGEGASNSRHNRNQSPLQAMKMGKSCE